jgi:protein involved in temperature-dependent protein secretion
VVYVKRKDWPRAIDAVEAALKIDPFSPESRSILIAIYLETGDHAKARAQFDILGVIHPDRREQIRPWFEERLRQRSGLR